MNILKTLKYLTENGIAICGFYGDSIPEEGYLVGIHSTIHHVPDMFDDILAEYIARNIEPLMRGDRFLAVLRFPDDYGIMIYEHIQGPLTAIEEGIMRGNERLWDCSKRRYIALPSPQTSGTEQQQREHARMKAIELSPEFNPEPLDA